ncbi:hypothetical protein BHU72_10365 [Desulfuribacillus stibiiarsenatis]|uniref:Hydrogenase maturation protease n=1 Tax=Desulfuribacillus stibiiarsenatis TaxID=1390249 RepID=A0A1E5L945_9FIRM|nr:HyaD/HybD family hydrogenase maturation endopeptidase [Desulfuribacillus stibiiarsenatis]OEH86646.1 hypothetical protein BHU72_10365 [Desulfuribacillus stibiiarsenatis]
MTNIIAMGIGNTLCTDEGLGVKAIYQLMEQNWHESIELIDGACDGLKLLEFIERADKLLIIDAINADEEPGTIVQIEDDEVPLYTGIRLSTHQGTLQELLGLAKFRGMYPEKLILLGVQPGSLEWGTELSDPIAQSMPEILQRAEAILREWEKEI